MKDFKYKIEKLKDGEPDYAIRFAGDGEVVYAKVKGGSEFETSFADNRTAFDVYLSGNEVSKDEYDSF